MGASLLLKRFEATFIECARDKFAQDLHSPRKVTRSLMGKVSNLSGDRRLRLRDREAAALCEILLEVETFEAPRSEAEVQLAREILDRLELPNDWDNPFEFAKVVATAREENFRPEPEPPERPDRHHIGKASVAAEQPGTTAPMAPYWP
jgi:hypothetical protein